VIHFLDTSALVKRYIVEAGSEQVRRRFRSGTLAAARIAYAELAAALARRQRERDLTATLFESIMERLDEDFGKLVVVEIRPALIERVPDLVRKHPLRGYDAVQLAAALSLRARGAVELWAADGALLTAARGEGLRVVDV
jgi:predicted nucleic acid-binding protein